MRPLNLLVLSKPNGSYLRLLDQLPEGTNITVGNELEMFSERAPEADVLVNCFTPLHLFHDVFVRAPKLQWVHSLSVGVENTLFPELIASPVPLTNVRGAFSRSLGEFAILAALYFEKKIGEMKKQQSERRWVNMDVDELHGKTMGIVSYGSIGQAAARLAKAFGMNVWAMRKRPEMSKDDPLVDKLFGLDGLKEMMAASDYVVVCSPITPETRGMIGAAELAVMKPSALLINVGRGPVVVESALIDVLQSGKIRGAALDVFDTEPLPESHAFWGMDNVLLSPHSADHTPGWTDHAMEIFIDNFNRFAKGEPLLNLVDKKAGY